jgi:hypothetical protein
MVWLAEAEPLRAQLAEEAGEPALGRRLIDQLHQLEEQRLTGAREAKAFHLRPEPAAAELAARAVVELRGGRGQARAGLEGGRSSLKAT